MIAVLLSVLAVSAEPEPAPKSSAPPCILTVYVKGDHLVARFTQSTITHVKERVKVNKNGKEEEVEVTKVIPETREVEQKFELKKAAFSTAGGKKLTLEDAKKQLEKPRPVAISTDGRAVAEAYLKLFDKDVIVVILPLPEPGDVEKGPKPLPDDKRPKVVEPDKAPQKLPPGPKEM